jgi:hypothetical protein
MIYDTMITVNGMKYTGYGYYEPYTKEYPLMNISKERTILVS